MAKVQIKSEKLTPFGGVFSMMQGFCSSHAYCLKSLRRVRGNVVASNEFY
jgi:hypothetical protein